MRKVIISEKEQLKCNFCTRWFTVQSDFATIQRYSLNACPKCFNNFKYQLINPQTYEIYHVLLLNTGFKLTNKEQQINDIFNQLVQEHQNQKEKKLLYHYDNMVNNIHLQAKSHITSMKQRISTVCQKLIQNLVKNWQQVINNFNSFETMVLKQKERKIKIIQQKNYDFVRDSQKLLDKKRNLQILNIFNEKKQTLMMVDQVHLLKRIMNSFQYNQKINKQNIAPLKLLNKQKSIKSIKTLRQAVVNKKIQNSKVCERKRTHSKSIIGQSQKSERQISSNKSNKNLFGKIQCSNFQIQKQFNIFDQYRSQVINNINFKETYQSYIPTQQHSEVNKPSQQCNKIYGEKNMIQNIVNLKLKSLVNENQFQLINESLSGTNIVCYLKSLDWQSTISIVKVVKTNLNDDQFDNFLFWLSKKQNVQTLVLTNNHLTEKSVKALLGFIERHKDSKLKNIYLGNNYIKCSRIKYQIQALRQKNISIYA